MAPERDRRRRLFPSRLPLPKGIDEAALVVVVVGPLGLSLDVARAPLFVVVVAPLDVSFDLALALGFAFAPRVH